MESIWISRGWEEKGQIQARRWDGNKIGGLGSATNGFAEEASSGKSDWMKLPMEWTN
jgi:hypothetical protein